MAETEIQHISDESGRPVSVIVPIELWREIESEQVMDLPPGEKRPA